MEIEIQQLHTQLEAKERKFRRTSSAYQDLEQQAQLIRKASEFQMTEQSQSLDGVKQELAEKSQEIEELTQNNAQLSLQYDSICKQLEEALEINENQK